MDPLNPEVRQALQNKDPFTLSEVATQEQLARLKGAEELIAADQNRIRTTSRFTVAAQVLVSWVAILGFLVNAYQTYSNNQNQHQQAKIDQDRWNKEFERSRQEDKYNAFFQTSGLATDSANSDKRLVGYALLQEFVSDPEYTGKAMLMLEESLSQELRTNVDQGIDDAHRNAVSAIVTALSQTRDCHALARAARSIDRLAKRHKKFGDVVESSEVFQVYIFRLVGQAAEVCGTFDEFRAVRRPLRDTLIKIPEMGAAQAPLTVAAANTRVAELLRDACLNDMKGNGASDCPQTFASYAQLCLKPDTVDPASTPTPDGGIGVASKGKKSLTAETVGDEAGACALMRDVASRTPVPPPLPVAH